MLSVAWLVPAPHADAQSYQFNTVQIDGNERIGDSAILSRAGIARGRAISAGELNDAYQNLQASGLFESVALEPRGGTLVITVVEFPTINRISFEGNARIDDEALASVVDSDERRVFNPTQAEKDANAIAQAYSNDGRIAARVQPKVIRRDQNRVDLVFEVFEGDNVEIERLSFVGNREYSDRRLRRVLGTKQAGLFRRLIKRDTFVPERIEADQQMRFLPVARLCRHAHFGGERSADRRTRWLFRAVQRARGATVQVRRTDRDLDHQRGER